MREVVMEMCERRECGFEITFCEGSPPPSLSFFGFCLTMGYFGLMFLPPHTVLPSKYLYVFVS
jgi:hypothetical protein